MQDIARLAAASHATLLVRDHDIHEAAAKGDLDRLSSILDFEPRMVDFRDQDDWTPLHTAVCHDQPLAVSLLIQRGADVHARLKLGDRRIHKAGGCRQALLFDLGRYSGASPLHVAALLGQKDCAEVLLAAGADVQFPDDDNLHALQYAAMSGRRLFGSDGSCSVPVAELLVTFGADVNESTPDSVIPDTPITPIHIAAGHGNYAMVQWLIDRGVDVNGRDYDDRIDYDPPTCLHDATQSGDARMVELLLRNHADVDALAMLVEHQDGDELYGWRGTPLLWAAVCEANEVAAVLLDWGANGCFRESEWGYTPLLIAVENFNRPLVELLVKRGVDPNVPNNFGQTALHRAVARLPYGEAEALKLQVLELLLDYGADVNARDEHGLTPLDCIRRRHEEGGSADAVQSLLLAHGAESGLVERKG
ncbi:MAG: hypothetical protein GX575_27845 [Candidatus Anammoximicrobium sp.]|nr:hypothetical protein [Candidatus Anammoximicrobium sp.]